MVNEGGSIEVDGSGVMILCESSTLNSNRNEGLSRQKAEKLFSQYYGVRKLIWLKGRAGQDITDCHIDGFVKFVNGRTMITFSGGELQEWGISESDIQRIYSATNAQN